MTFDAFVAEVRGLLEPTASGKGYNSTGVDGPNDLYSFVMNTVDGHGHAMGECIYKVVRYSRKRNPEDLIKAAAWCFLILKHAHQSSGSGSRSKDRTNAGNGKPPSLAGTATSGTKRKSSKRTGSRTS